MMKLLFFFFYLLEQELENMVSNRGLHLVLLQHHNLYKNRRILMHTTLHHFLQDIQDQAMDYFHTFPNTHHHTYH
jgi:hypothetical protein